MALHTLLYTSVAVHEMEKKDLLGILKSARYFNTQANITGLLLYYPRSFMQVIEGEKEVVFKLYDRIALDNRHTDVNLTFDEPIDTRLFPDWSMGFFLLDDDMDKTFVEGFSRFFEEGFMDEDALAKKSLAKYFLLSFKDKADFTQRR